MPNYNYTARSFDGTIKKGTISAGNVQGLIQALKNEGFVLVNYKTESDKNRRFNLLSAPIFTVSAREKVILTRNLWIMFSSGLALTKTLDILAAQSRNKVLKNALTDISNSITRGNSFSGALERYPRIFSELYVNMVKVGEESGKLEEVFENLAIHLEKEYDLKAKVRGALIYPCIVLVVIFIIGSIVVTFVLPRLNIFFVSMGVQVPIYTKILLGAGVLAERFWYLLFVFPFLAAVTYLLIRRKHFWKVFRDSTLLKTPLISALVKKNSAVMFLRSLSALMISGVPLLRSLEITAEVVQNIYVRKTFLEAVEGVKRGEKLSASLKPHSHLFPIGTIEIMEVGEETGKTSDLLKKLAEFYEQEMVNATQNLATIVESLLIIFLGLMVGIFAVSIIQPMYSTLQFIQ